MSVYSKLKGLFAAEEIISPHKSTHITYLVIILLFLVLPFFISYAPNQKDQDAPPELLNIKLPPSCLSEQLFGSECPGCGLTRSFVLFTHGHFKEAWKIHRLGPLIYLFFIWLAAFKIYCLCNPGKKLKPLTAELQFILPFTLLCLIFINWLVGIFIGGN